MRRLTEVLILFISIFLLACCCDSGYHEIVIEPWDVLLVKLENAWNTLNIPLLESCFRDDFLHHLQSQDWDDYDGDGIIDQYWELEIELEFAENISTEADSIYFSFSGGESFIWSGDSTGQSIQMLRILTREICFPSDTTLEVRPVTLICRPDSQGEWYIWQWFDGEEQK
ncbi:MAG: hypothetical protein KAT09_05440 [Candidatus Aegiribacteria sp.]|nr:hypothetical protein [Candidatus Aegiribacteria sp.]